MHPTGFPLCKIKKPVMIIRSVTSGDRQAVTTLIESVYGEYGEQVCLDGAEADLLTLPEPYRQQGGEFVVLDDGGRIRGTHAVLPLDHATRICTFRRLYLEPELRGQGWGERLMQWAVDWASERGFVRVEFWSDIRFERAHRFFRRLGFVSDGTVREMDDARSRSRAVRGLARLLSPRP